jgi:HEAT repeat protein
MRIFGGMLLGDLGAWSQQSRPLCQRLKASRDLAAGDLEEAIHALGDIDPAAKDAVPRLVEALKDKDSLFLTVARLTIRDVRQTPADTLSIGPARKHAVLALIEAFKDPGVRQDAAAALGRIIAPDAMPALIATLNDKGTH